MRTCVCDNAFLDDASQENTLTGASKETCATTPVDVVAVPVLSIEVQESEDPADPGSIVDSVVTLKNLEFELDSSDPRFGELPTQGAPIVGLALTGEATTRFAIHDASTADGVCTPGGDTSFECGIADIPYGELVDVALSGTLDMLAPGLSIEGVALEAQWLGLPEPIRGAAKVEVASNSLAPVLSDLTPGVGEPSGFEEVTLEGSNFEVGARVLFGTRQATRVTVVNSTMLTLVTPAQPEGTVDVTVINPSDEQSMLADAWTYQVAQPPPGGGGGGSGGRGSGGGAGFHAARCEVRLTLP